LKKNVDYALIELNKIVKIYDNEYTAVDGINLSIKKGEFVTLLGPSGCGKTTTLRMIAGFESPSFGQIKIKGLDIKKVPPYNRPTATVFQNYSLFPHMNVYQNVAYGLKVMTVRLEDVKESKIKEIERNFEKETRLAKKEAKKINKIKDQVLKEIEKINAMYESDKFLYSIRKMRDKNFSRRIELLEEKIENSKTAKEKTMSQKNLENLLVWYEKKKPIDKKMDKKLKELQKLENEISYIISRPFLKKEQMEEKNLSRKLTKKEIHEKVINVLKKVGLEGYEEKSISHLSGGQQQRVALARAIVIEPEILLLDEPLSALDAKVRKDLQFELKRLHKELGITFILVTHDQEEALTLSSKIVVMSKGKIEQIGAPNKIYDSPANE
jgi:spermidine/putrescine transport system ATP-binding protein